MKRNRPYYSRGQQLTKLALKANIHENVNKKNNSEVLAFLRVPSEHTTPYAIELEENELDKNNSLLPDLSLTDMTIGSIGSTSLTCLDSGFIVPVDKVKNNEDCGTGIGSYTSLGGTLTLPVAEIFGQDTMTYPTAETLTQTSQNKNWALLSFFIYIINSNEIDALEITLKYFEPGHSFMSADSFHHRVELSMKRAGGKIYDFQDFSQAVLQSSKNVDVKILKYEDFYQWIDYTSQYKLQKLNPRPYLHDMVEITFRKGSHDIFYKKSYDGEVFAVNFLLAKFTKTRVLTGPKQNNKPSGISKDKKKTLIKALEPIMIKNRLKFWNDLPVSD